jgi:hypothetical protein
MGMLHDAKEIGISDPSYWRTILVLVSSLKAIKRSEKIEFRDVRTDTEMAHGTQHKRSLTLVDVITAVIAAPFIVVNIRTYLTTRSRNSKKLKRFWWRRR